VWIYEGGRWILFKEVMKKPLGEEYLAIGAKISLSLRKLPHSANSQLRYQARSSSILGLLKGQILQIS
jgi:hypothetical protein